MRINRQTLLNIAEETVARRVRESRGILSAYLCGSLLGEDYLLGGTADIDLVFVHIDTPSTEREIVGLTDQVHMDIAHYAQKEFRNTRKLRLHPWFGPAINECKVLHDPQHFMDFTLASVRGQFDRPEHVMGRAFPQLQLARQIWSSLADRKPGPVSPAALGRYLRAVEHGVNAVALLSGPPLTERRLLLNFPNRADVVGRPGLYPGVLGILGAINVAPETIGTWVDGWQIAIGAVPEDERPPRLHASRQAYYQQAVGSMLGSDRPQAALWPVLRTWTIAVNLLPDKHAGRAAWKQACQELGLHDTGFSERVIALDAYLDTIDECLDHWSSENGI